jgi:3-phenylpropionate/trans-cinnamate dioxygenase ferredoxin reductase subunit
LRQPYAKAPWFWSDQYDVKLQIAGVISRGDTSVVRGMPEDNRFSVFHFRDRRFLGAESLGRAIDHLVARRCLTEGLSISPETVADNSVDLLAVANAAKERVMLTGGG